MSRPSGKDASEVWVGTDPALLFVNPASGDLHARRTSEAIDSCDGFYWTPTDRDLDDQEWAWDDPSWTNYLGAYDRGADEARPIFVDGFESGGTGGWSSAVG